MEQQLAALERLAEISTTVMAATGRMVAAQAMVLASLLALLEERGGIPIADVHRMALATAERQGMGPELAALVNGILLPPDSAGASN